VTRKKRRVFFVPSSRYENRGAKGDPARTRPRGLPARPPSNWLMPCFSSIPVRLSDQRADTPLPEKLPTAFGTATVSVYKCDNPGSRDYLAYASAHSFSGETFGGIVVAAQGRGQQVFTAGEVAVVQLTIVDFVVGRFWVGIIG